MRSPVGAAAEFAERPKRRYARTKSVLEALETRGAISQEQKRASDRLAWDHYTSNTLIGRLTASYGPRMRPRAKYQAVPETPLSVPVRECYDDAIGAAGRWFTPILVHSASQICPQLIGPAPTASELRRYRPASARLDGLVCHYGEHRREVAADDRCSGRDRPRSTAPWWSS
jgi:hypothetical protein